MWFVESSDYKHFLFLNRFCWKSHDETGDAIEQKTMTGPPSRLDSRQLIVQKFASEREKCVADELMVMVHMHVYLEFEQEQEELLLLQPVSVEQHRHDCWTPLSLLLLY